MSRSKKSTLMLAAENEVMAQQSSDFPEETKSTVEAPANPDLFPGLVEDKPAQQSSDFPEETKSTVEAPANTDLFPGLVEDKPAKASPSYASGLRVPEGYDSAVLLSDLVNVVKTEGDGLKLTLKRDLGELKAGLRAIVASASEVAEGKLVYAPTVMVGAGYEKDPVTLETRSKLPLPERFDKGSSASMRYCAKVLSEVIKRSVGTKVWVTV